MRVVLVDIGARIFELPKQKCACGMIINYEAAPAGDCYIYTRTARRFKSMPEFEYVRKEP